GGFNFTILHLSADGTQLLTSPLSGQGALVLINTQPMQVEASVARLDNPHGIAANPTFDTFYVTGQYGNTVYKVVRGASVKKLSIDGKPSVTKTAANTPDPHEIM